MVAGIAGCRELIKAKQYSGYITLTQNDCEAIHSGCTVHTERLISLCLRTTRWLPTIQNVIVTLIVFQQLIWPPNSHKTTKYPK